jgi:putative transposase
LTAICRFIEGEAKNFPVKEMCAVLGVSRTSYYRWVKPPEANEQEVQVRAMVRETFFRHSRRYGSRRLEVELKSQGLGVGRHRLRRLMKEECLWAIQPRRFVPRTTDSGHCLGYSENLLIGVKLPPAHPNEVVVGDMTCLPLQSGSFAYLATWADLFSRLVIGWEVEQTMGESLILMAFEKGLRRRGDLRGPSCTVMAVGNMRRGGFALC